MEETGAKSQNVAGVARPLRRTRPRLVGLIVGAVAIAALFAFILHVGDLEEFARTARRADPAWILLALAAQALAFLTQASVWALALLRRESHVGLRDLFVLSIGKLFADQAIPSAGVSGAVFIVHAMTRRGVSASDAFAAFIFGATSFILMFAIFALGAFVALFLSGGPLDEFAVNVSDLHYVAIVGVLLAFTIVALAFAAQENGALKSQAVKNAADSAVRAIRLIWLDRGLFAACLALQAIARLLDAVTLWIAFQALGGGVSFPVCVVAISLASLAATVAPTPMGLGSFEVGLIAALAALGLEVETSFAGGVIYRGLSLFLPLAVGFFIVQRELLRK